MTVQLHPNLIWLQVNPCAETKCLNGGTCTTNHGFDETTQFDYKCECFSSQYTGYNCQKDSSISLSDEAKQTCQEAAGELRFWFGKNFEGARILQLPEWGLRIFWIFLHCIKTKFSANATAAGLPMAFLEKEFEHPASCKKYFKCSMIQSPEEHECDETKIFDRTIGGCVQSTSLLKDSLCTMNAS